LDKRSHFILISENKAWRSYLRSALKKQGAEFVEAESVEEAGGIASQHQIDIILLDLTSRQDNINEPCRYLKDELLLKDVPIVAFILNEQLPQLDVSQDIEDFIIQRDDYQEALVRIKRVVWQILQNNKSAITIGELTLDPENYEASIKGEPIYFTFKEFELLKFLLLNRGRVFSRDDLLDKVWGYDNYVGTRTVDIHIQRLRNKLGSPLDDMIITVRNVGYKFSS